jgi:hypothetical protein
MKSRYRKRPYRKKRYTKRIRRGSKRNIMQRQESAGIVKKYTRVFLADFGETATDVGTTISLCGGKKLTQDCLTFGDVNPDK